MLICYDHINRIPFLNQIIGVCIGNNDCLCLPGFKTEHCASRISKFSVILEVSSIQLSFIDIYLIMNILTPLFSILRLIYRICTVSKPGENSLKNAAGYFIFTHFNSPNLIHFTYSVFIYHKYAPTLYSIIGSNNFMLLLVVCHSVRMSTQFCNHIFLLKSSSSAISMTNLTIIMLLNQLKNGRLVQFDTNFLFECVRYISIDILLSLDLGSFWIILQATICAKFLLEYIL